MRTHLSLLFAALALPLAPGLAQTGSAMDGAPRLDAPGSPMLKFLTEPGSPAQPAATGGRSLTEFILYTTPASAFPNLFLAPPLDDIGATRSLDKPIEFQLTAPAK